MDSDPLAHPDEAVAARDRRRHPAPAVVDHLHRDAGIGVVDVDRGSRRAGVLDHVGERLLHDAVRREIDAGRHVGPVPVDRELDVDAGARHVGHQPVEVCEPRGGDEGGRLVAVGRAQDAEEPAHLPQRRAGRGLDGGKRPLGRRRIVGGHHPPGAGVHRHHAHAVGDHVVQLAGDAQPLLGHRLAGQVVLGPLQLAVLGLQRLGVEPAGTDGVAEEPGAGDEHGHAGVRRARADRRGQSRQEDGGNQQPAARPLREPGGGAVDGEQHHREKRRRVLGRRVRQAAGQGEGHGHDRAGPAQDHAGAVGADQRQRQHVGLPDLRIGAGGDEDRCAQGEGGQRDRSVDHHVAPVH